MSWPAMGGVVLGAWTAAALAWWLSGRLGRRLAPGYESSPQDRRQIRAWFGYCAAGVAGGGGALAGMTDSPSIAVAALLSALPLGFLLTLIGGLLFVTADIYTRRRTGIDASESDDRR